MTTNPRSTSWLANVGRFGGPFGLVCAAIALRSYLLLALAVVATIAAFVLTVRARR